MASINLLPRKCFEITLNDGTVVRGQYGTWSLKRFCDKQKLSLGQLQDKKPLDYSMSDIVDLILCAVEQKTRQDKTGDFAFTDVDACSWIDELGGIFSPDVTSLFNHQSSGIEQKKTEPPPEP